MIKLLYALLYNVRPCLIEAMIDIACYNLRLLTKDYKMFMDIWLYIQLNTFWHLQID